MKPIDIAKSLSGFLMAALYQSMGLSGRQFVKVDLEGIPNMLLGSFFLFAGILLYLRLYKPFLYAGTKTIKTKKGTRKVRVKAKGMRKIYLSLIGFVTLVIAYIGMANILRGVMHILL